MHVRMWVIGMMDMYVCLFLIRWLDKLGLAAVINHTLVLRQTFIGGSYSLLDSSSKPLPVGLTMCVDVSV